MVGSVGIVLWLHQPSSAFLPPPAALQWISASRNPAVFEVCDLLGTLVMLQGLQSKPMESAGALQVPSVGLDQTFPALLSSIPALVWCKFYSDNTEGTTLVWLQNTEKMLLKRSFYFLWEEKITYFICWGAFLIISMFSRGSEVSGFVIWARVKPMQTLTELWGSDRHRVVLCCRSLCEAAASNVAHSVL